MAATFSWALQKIIVEQLRKQDELNAYVEGRIYDVVPANPKFPYIVLGSENLKPWNSKTSQGCEYQFLIHVFTRDKGRKELKEILYGIEEILDSNIVGLEDAHLVQLSLDSTQTYIEADQATCHGIMKVKCIATFGATFGASFR